MESICSKPCVSRGIRRVEVLICGGDQTRSSRRIRSLPPRKLREVGFKVITPDAAGHFECHHPIQKPPRIDVAGLTAIQELRNSFSWRGLQEWLFRRTGGFQVALVCPPEFGGLGRIEHDRS